MTVRDQDLYRRMDALGVGRPSLPTDPRLIPHFRALATYQTILDKSHNTLSEK